MIRDNQLPVLGNPWQSSSELFCDRGFRYSPELEILTTDIKASKKYREELNDDCDVHRFVTCRSNEEGSAAYVIPVALTCIIVVYFNKSQFFNRRTWSMKRFLVADQNNNWNTNRAARPSPTQTAPAAEPNWTHEWLLPDWFPHTGEIDAAEMSDRPSYNICRHIFTYALWRLTVAELSSICASIFKVIWNRVHEEKTIIYSLLTPPWLRGEVDFIQVPAATFRYLILVNILPKKSQIRKSG